MPGAIRPRAISGAIQSNVRKGVHATVQESIAQGDQVDRAIVHKVFRTIANDPSGTVFFPNQIEQQLIGMTSSDGAIQLKYEAGTVQVMRKTIKNTKMAETISKIVSWRPANI